MKSNNLIILILIVINCSFSKNIIQVNFTNFTLNVKESVKELFSQIYNITENKTECIKDLNNYYEQSNNSEKFILDSSKTKNDLIPYLYCLENNNTDESIFIITKIYELEKENISTSNNTNSTNSTNDNIQNLTKFMIYPDNYIIGLCLPNIKSCQPSFYKYIISKIFELRYDLFNVDISKIDFQIIQIKNNESVYNNFKLINILNFIPLILIFIQLILCIFPSIARKLIILIRNLICCSKKKANISYYNPIKKAFSISENIDELYGNAKTNSKVNNDAGLKFIIGLRGINILFMIIGIVFQILIHSPSHIHSTYHFTSMIQSRFYGIIFYSVRYAPRILFACSGFILSYKLLCYFDDRAEEMRDKRFIQKEKELIDTNNKNKKFSALPIKPKIKINNDVTFGNVIIFIIYQIHKYLIFILIICFFRFTIYYIQFKRNINPFWKLLYETIINKITVLHLVSEFLLFRHFLFKLGYYLKPSQGDSNIINQENSIIDSSYLDFNWIFVNEAFFFIIGTIFLFVFHKIRKLKIFYIIIGIVITFIIIKIVIYYFLFSPLEYLSNYGYGKIFKNPLFNISFYLIGLYFGCINYIIEKRYNAEIINEQKRTYLLLPAHHANTICTSKKKLLFKYIWLFYIIVLLCSEMHLINYKLHSDKNNKILGISNCGEIILTILLLFDTELIVLGIFLASIYYFIKINNLVNRILSFNIWIRYHKLYYSYIITLPSVCLYFLYQSESRIIINFSNTLFYSTIIMIITHIFAGMVFVLFEMPYKRLIKLLLKIKLKENEKDKDNSVYEGNEVKIIL